MLHFYPRCQAQPQPSAPVAQGGGAPQVGGDAVKCQLEVSLQRAPDATDGSV